MSNELARQESRAGIDNPQNDPEWNQIVEQIVSELGNELPERVVQATELLLAGWPVYKIAKRLGVETKTVRTWLQSYPSMAMAVSNGRKLLFKWRMSRLEQQFVQAMDKSEEILDIDLDDRAVNAKVVQVVAQQARYIIGLFVGQKMDVNVNVNQATDSTLKAKEDALDYLAQELAALRQADPVVEGSYTIEEVEPKSAREHSSRPPLLSEDGLAPFGDMGLLEATSEGTRCHACGKAFKSLGIHISLAHKLNAREYENLYMLVPGSVAQADGMIKNG